MQCNSVSRLCRMWEEVGGSDQVAKRREGVGLIPTTTPARRGHQTSLADGSAEDYIKHALHARSRIRATRAPP